MLKVELKVTDDEIKKLKKESRTAKLSKTMIKAKVLYFRAIGQTDKEIMAKTDLTTKTIVRYVRDFNENGIESIYKTKHKGQPSKMNDFSEKIMADFKEKPPKTIAEAGIRIEKLTGLTRTYNAVRQFLLKKGLLTKKQEAYRQKQIDKSKKSS